MMGPGDDLESLSKRNDHLGVLRYIRAHELREPTVVIRHGKALLGDTLAKKLQDAQCRTAALEQICLAACDVHDQALANTCLEQIKVDINNGNNGEGSCRYQCLLGRCLEAAEDYDGAMMVYDDLLKDNPSNLLALQRKYCVARAQKKDPQVVIEALNEYLGQQLSDVSGWYDMAQLRLSLADYKGAAYALEQVVLGSPLEADVHRQLAETYATLGGIDNTLLARRHMAQALELDPTNVRAQLGLVSVAGQYLEESNDVGKKSVDEHEQLVAKELVRYGAAEVLKSYRGSKLFASVKRVMDDYTDNLE
jgi:tetratricopeptide (TPR) repeat protein